MQSCTHSGESLANNTGGSSMAVSAGTSRNACSPEVGHGGGADTSHFRAFRTVSEASGMNGQATMADSADTIRMYVNGQVVGVSHKNNWGRVTCGMRKVRCWDDVVGCNDTCAGTFAVDDLKIWDYAKTDFN